MVISTILSQIDLGSYAMPVFQRGYVWNRDQVKKLMNSLYRGYPIGQLLVWDTATDESLSRGNGQLTPGHVNLILDGQQRITTLYGIIRGIPPKFFDGNASSFTGLYFNIEDETFEFYMPAKMGNNRSWISVTELLQKSASVFIQERAQTDPDNPDTFENSMFWMKHMGILNKLDSIKNMDIHVEVVSGADKTIDVVVDIFNNVNSGGTKLSKGDLALAKICGEWPEARDQMKAIITKYKKAGYDFKMDWLLRCVTVYITGQPYFNALSSVKIDQIKSALPQTDKQIGNCLDQIGSRLGLDHGRVLGNVFSIVTMIGYLRSRNWKLSGSAEWDRLLYWYVNAFLWARYAGSTESTLAQDLNTVSDGLGIDGLIARIKQMRGNVTIHPDDIKGWSTGTRFYPLLYMLTRTNHARDWGTNLELNASLLGKNSTLDVHHIFPKKILYAAGKDKSLVNALANYALITKATNIEISDTPPEEYMPVYRARCPGAVDTHWVPNDPALWKVDNYETFLEKRRVLLANAANTFLDSLYNGNLGIADVKSFSTKQYSEEKDEAEEIDSIQTWMESYGLDPGVINYELLDKSGEASIIDLAWPQGIQRGLSNPAALLLNETSETQFNVQSNGYQIFTDVDAFKDYIQDTFLQ